MRCASQLDTSSRGAVDRDFMIKSFNFWINNNFVNKIILIENSNFDLSYFREIAKKIKNKEIEIISSTVHLQIYSSCHVQHLAILNYAY